VASNYLLAPLPVPPQPASAPSGEAVDDPRLVAASAHLSPVLSMGQQ